MKTIALIRHAESLANAGQATLMPAGIALTENGRRQAAEFAAGLTEAPQLIVCSPFERARATAAFSARRFARVPVQEWPVEEFTYLAPARFVGTTQAQRKPQADAYWQRADADYIDGPGAESFTQLMGRAERMLARLAALEADRVLVFSHGQFIRAVSWWLQHGARATEPALMRGFRAMDSAAPLPNTGGYRLVLEQQAWQLSTTTSFTNPLPKTDRG